MNFIGRKLKKIRIQHEEKYEYHKQELSKAYDEILNHWNSDDEEKEQSSDNGRC